MFIDQCVYKLASPTHSCLYLSPAPPFLSSSSFLLLLRLRLRLLPPTSTLTNNLLIDCSVTFIFFSHIPTDTLYSRHFFKYSSGYSSLDLSSFTEEEMVKRRREKFVEDGEDKGEASERPKKAMRKGTRAKMATTAPEGVDAAPAARSPGEPAVERAPSAAPAAPARLLPVPKELVIDMVDNLAPTEATGRGHRTRKQRTFFAEAAPSKAKRKRAAAAAIVAEEDKTNPRPSKKRASPTSLVSIAAAALAVATDMPPPKRTTRASSRPASSAVPPPPPPQQAKNKRKRAAADDDDEAETALPPTKKGAKGSAASSAPHPGTPSMRESNAVEAIHAHGFAPLKDVPGVPSMPPPPPPPPPPPGPSAPRPDPGPVRTLLPSPEFTIGAPKKRKYRNAADAAIAAAWDTPPAARAGRGRWEGSVMTTMGEEDIGEWDTTPEARAGPRREEGSGLTTMGEDEIGECDTTPAARAGRRMGQGRALITMWEEDKEEEEEATEAEGFVIYEDP